MSKENMNFFTVKFMSNPLIPKQKQHHVKIKEDVQQRWDDPTSCPGSSPVTRLGLWLQIWANTTVFTVEESTLSNATGMVVKFKAGKYSFSFYRHNLVEEDLNIKGVFAKRERKNSPATATWLVNVPRWSKEPEREKKIARELLIGYHKVSCEYLLRLMRPPKMDPLSKASFHLKGTCISDGGILDSKATIWS